MSNKQPANSLAERGYERLFDEEEDARVCRDIDDTACREVPGNFWRQLSALSLTKFGDAIVSAKTVLAWLMSAVGAPGYLFAFLVPIRESGSMLPQLAIGAVVRRMPVRKWAWVLGSTLQAGALFAMALLAAQLQGAAAGWAIIACLIVFSLSRGLCSVAAKDVHGKTVPKTRRGRLAGLSASVAGGVAIGVGLLLMLGQGVAAEKTVLLGLLVVAGVFWLLAAVLFASVKESPGEIDGGKNGLMAAFSSLRLLASDAPFRRFVIARGLMLCSALTAPWLVAMAQQGGGSGLADLGLFVVAAGLAQFVSSPVWGGLADRSSRQVMMVAALATALLGGVTFSLATWLPHSLSQLGVLPLLYFVLSVCHSGVRVGRKTYVVDLGGGNKRTDYVAVSNTVIGVALLLAGAVGLLQGLIGSAGIILLLSFIGLAGAGLATTLPEVQND
jgi:hypothetical protein